MNTNSVFVRWDKSVLPSTLEGSGRTLSTFHRHYQHNTSQSLLRNPHGLFLFTPGNKHGPYQTETQGRDKQISDIYTVSCFYLFEYILIESETYYGPEWLMSLISCVTTFLSKFTSCVLGLPWLIQSLRATRYQLLLQTQCYVCLHCLSSLTLWIICMLWWSSLLGMSCDWSHTPPTVLSVVFLFSFLSSFCSFLAACKIKDRALFPTYFAYSCLGESAEL